MSRCGRLRITPDALNVHVGEQVGGLGLVVGHSVSSGDPCTVDG